MRLQEKMTFVTPCRGIGSKTEFYVNNYLMSCLWQLVVQEFCGKDSMSERG